MARPEVKYTITVEQDEQAVRGNALASGDDAVDKAQEDEILARLDRGDVWAWAEVTVTAECAGFKGVDYLCGCCYENEAAFKEPGGYFPDMCAAALENLREVLCAAVTTGNDAAELLARLDAPDARCDYCAGSGIPGIHLPSDFDDREPSRDGKVFVAKCDACFTYQSDCEAAEVVAARMGWKIHRSMDKKDALDPEERREAKNAGTYRPYFEITLADAERAHKPLPKKEG